MNHKWNYQPITSEQAEISQTLVQELGISPILGRLLVQRGITRYMMPGNSSVRNCPTCMIHS